MFFKLTEEQLEKLYTWATRQRQDKKSEGCSGGRFSYIFTPTSIGMVTKVEDNITHEKLDLTNYKDW